MASTCVSCRAPVAATSRSLQSARPRATPFTSAPLRPQLPTRSAGRAVAAKAKEVDFDQFLIDLQDKFEASENKPVVIGYSMGAVFAFFFAEWFIHLPLFNVLVGFPIELLGLLLTPYLAIRYFKEGEDWYSDASDAFDKVVALLPGLKK